MGRHTLHMLDWGNDHLPPLLLIHGIRLHAHVWNDFCRRYHGQYHLMALDLRGHGDSSWCQNGEYHLHDYYEDVREVIAQLDEGPLVLLGHSLGARVSLLYTHLHPEQVRSLILVDMGAGLPAHLLKQDFSRVTETPPPREFASPEEAVEYIASILNTGPRDLMEESVRHGLRQLPNGNFTWKYDPALSGPPQPRAGAREWDLWEAAATVQCPALLLHGANSMVVSQDIVERMAATMPQLHTVRVEEAGHALFSDQPTVFANEVGAFLTANP